VDGLPALNARILPESIQDGFRQDAPSRVAGAEGQRVEGMGSRLSSSSATAERGLEAGQALTIRSIPAASTKFLREIDQLPGCCVGGFTPHPHPGTLPPLRGSPTTVGSKIMRSRCLLISLLTRSHVGCRVSALVAFPDPCEAASAGRARDPSRLIPPHGPRGPCTTSTRRSGRGSSPWSRHRQSPARTPRCRPRRRRPRRSLAARSATRR